MGTRGQIGWILPDGTVKGSYNHHDSYPSWLGRQMQDDLKKIATALGHPIGSDPFWDGLLGRAMAVEFVDSHATPTADHRARVRAANVEPDASIGDRSDYYSLLRSAQGILSTMLMLGLATDEAGFIKDSLFCEWAWLIDFRTREMVVLRGFVTDPGSQAAYATPDEPYRAGGENGTTYYGCREAWRGSIEDFLAINMSTFEEALEPLED